MKSSRTLVGHHDSVFDVCFGGTGSLASCGRDGLVFVWRTDERPEHRFDLGGSCAAIRFSPDSDRLAAAATSGRLLAWHANSFNVAWERTLPSVEVLEFSPDCGRLVVGGTEGRLWLLDAASGRDERTLRLEGSYILSLAFSPDGTLIAVATSDAGIYFIETETWQTVHRLELPGCSVNTCVFSPDGVTFAATMHFRRGGSIGTSANPDLFEIAVWEPLATDPEFDSTLLGHVSWMKGLAFSPSGDLLISGGFDQSIRLWDPHFHTQLAETREHQGAVYAIAFSADGSSFASCSADGTIKIWDVAGVLSEGDSGSPVDVSTLEEMVRGLETGDRPGHSPLLVTAQRIADGLLALDSVKELNEALARVVDVALSLGLIELGQAVTQTISVRGEQARRTQDDIRAFKCSRINSFLSQAIQDHFHRRFARILGGHEEPKMDVATHSETPISREVMRLLDEVIDGTVDFATAVPRVRALGPTPSDLLLAFASLQQFLPDVLRGQRANQPVREAARVLVELADEADVVVAVTCDFLGLLLCVAGDNEAGLPLLERAAAAARQLDVPEVEQGIVGNLANAYRNVGRLREARRTYEQAIPVAKDGGFHEGLVNHLTGLAIVEGDVGNRAEEVKLLSEARAIALGHGLDEKATMISNNLGSFYVELGDFGGATDLFREALDGAKRSEDVTLQVTATGNLAQSLAALGERDAARDMYEHALAGAHKLADLGSAVHALTGLSMLAEADGDSDRATALAEEAVSAAEQLGVPTRLLAALLRLAGVRSRGGAAEAAIELLERAAKIGELLRSEIQHGGEGPRLQADIASVYEDLVLLFANAGKIERAFEASERGRAALLMRRLHGTAAVYEPRSARELLEGLAEVGRRAVLISYYFAGEELLVFVARPDLGVQLERRTVDPEFVASVHADFDREVRDTAGADIGEAWLELGRLVVEPILPHLDDASLLLLVPHAGLHNLPLHALAAGERRVIERWPVVYLPSASALPYLLAEEDGPPRAPLVVGAHFVREAATVAGLLSVDEPMRGDELEKEDLLAAIGRADLVHMSAHGFFSEREPDFSGWIIQPSPELGEYLELRERHVWERNVSQSQEIASLSDWAEARIVSASDLRSYRLNARLVVASACESGVIATDAADDPVGLIPALLSRGARGVVATLWLVDAETTEQMMNTFYSALVRNEGVGWGKIASAMQEAVKNVKEEHDHPYFWAPYVLVGGLTVQEAT